MNRSLQWGGPHLSWVGLLVLSSLMCLVIVGFVLAMTPASSDSIEPVAVVSSEQAESGQPVIRIHPDGASAISLEEALDACVEGGRIYSDDATDNVLVAVAGQEERWIPRDLWSCFNADGTRLGD